MSLGVNRLASSMTLVDSASLGSHADASFFWAPLSLPASGPATATTAIQKTRTAHLLHRPQAGPAIPLVAARPFPRSRSLFRTVPPSSCDAPVHVTLAPKTPAGGERVTSGGEHRPCRRREAAREAYGFGVSRPPRAGTRGGGGGRAGHARGR